MEKPKRSDYTDTESGDMAFMRVEREYYAALPKEQAAHTARLNALKVQVTVAIVSGLSMPELGKTSPEKICETANTIVAEFVKRGWTP